ncbi:MAG: FkbM family methyltransferase [Armatimonadetes bacterium]|nr:FkbM family methyltransferase [Akkermansiaceae bacterium]
MASTLHKIVSRITRLFGIRFRAIFKSNPDAEIKSLLVEHSRQMADNMELLCRLQTALCEKIDLLTKIQLEKLDNLSVVQNTHSTKLDEIAQRRSMFPLDAQRALVRTSVGYMVCDRCDAFLLGQLAETGDLEHGLRRFIERYLGEGMTFVDVGAHIGMHAIAAARCVGRKGKVHAFEATPATAQFLKHNVVQNGFGSQITVHAKFVGAAAGETSFHLCPINGHNSRYPLAHETAKIEVQVVALDDVLKDVPFVNLIKVDVEGAELDVFAGMSGLLQRSPDACVVAEFAPLHLNRSGTLVNQWEDFCKTQGFEVFMVEEPRGTLKSVSFSELMCRETANVLMARGNAFKKTI